MHWNRIAPAALGAVAAIALLAPGKPDGAAAAAAQAGGADSCPIVRVSCFDSSDEGSPGLFSVEVSGGDASVTPTHNWVVSDGTIASGQGTSSIQVATDGVGGRAITATVDIGGYDRACSTSRSCTSSVLARAVEFGEYETADLSAQKGLLDRWLRRSSANRARRAI